MVTIAPTVETKDAWEQVVLNCDIEWQENHTEIVYEVTWAVKNVEIKTEMIEGGQMPAKLYEFEWAGKFKLMGENV